MSLSEAYRAKMINGRIKPGPWFVPQAGPSRFTTWKKAMESGYAIRAQYGPYCYDFRVTEVPSLSRPGEITYLLEIRSLGVMEGLIKEHRE